MIMENDSLIVSEILLRTPFYPFDQIWTKSVHDKVLKDPIFLEALFVASPSFLKEFLKDPENRSDREDTAMLSAYKYFFAYVL